MNTHDAPVSPTTMTGRSISNDGAADYTRYLQSKTVAPARGDYLSPQGEPTQSPGRWHASAESLRRL